MGMRHIVMFGQSGSTILFHIISLTTRLSEEKLLDKNACFEFTYNFFLQLFSRKLEFGEIPYVYIHNRVMYPLCLSDFHET